MTRSRFWTTHEITAIRAHYPSGGVNACMPHIARSRGAIYQCALRLGLRTNGYTGARQRWPVDPDIDAQIKTMHRWPLHRGDIRILSQRIGRPTWWISNRARELGLVTPRFSEPPWTRAEIGILMQTAHLEPSTVRLHLKKAKFTRTETAIIVKRKRLGISNGRAQARQDAGIFNACEIADMLGIDRKAPLRWITRLGLRSTRLPDDGQHRIALADLREFLIANPYTIELRRIPASAQAWFIDLIADRAA